MDCVVVGSGIAGMTAGILLARRGHRTEVIEARPHPAPLLRGFVRDGTYFDTGFHCGGGVHHAGPLATWLRTLGVADAIGPCDRPVKESIWNGDGAVMRIPHGREGLLALAEGLDSECVPRLEHLLDDIETVLAHSPYVTPGVAGTGTTPSFPASRSVRLTERLAQADLPGELNQLLCIRCLDFGVPPSKASFSDYALVVGPYIASTGTWRGGGRALAEALVAALTDAGGSVACDARAETIEADAAGVRAVRLEDGRRIPCQGCIFTGHPAQLESLLPAGLLRKAWFTRIREFAETPSVHMTFGRIGADDAGEHVHYLLPAPKACLKDDPLALDVMFDPGSRAECLLAGFPDAAGRTPLALMQFIDSREFPPGDPRPRPQPYRSQKERCAAEAVALAREHCPDLMLDFETLATATPLTMRHHVHGGTGSLYGIAHEMSVLPLMPVTRLPGLWLAGQNILLPGVLGGIVSGAIAAGFAVGHESILAEFAECADR
jgi:all-trans-retinol 13,14-reductase